MTSLQMHFFAYKIIFPKLCKAYTRREQKNKNNPFHMQASKCV